jgi:hypothetical protein
MYPRIPCKVVACPLGPAEQTLGTTLPRVSPHLSHHQGESSTREMRENTGACLHYSV